MWRTVPDFLWSKFLAGPGFNVHASPVITVMVGSNCEAELPPGTKFAKSSSFTLIAG